MESTSYKTTDPKVLYEGLPLGMLIDLITKWHHDRNLIEGSSDAAQFLKLYEEMGELYGNILAGKSIKDDIGDMITVLINMAVRNDLTLNQCLGHAYNDIKDRKGKMVNGVFVKEK